MSYWFTDPRVKSLLPLASSTSMRGLSATFTTPTIFMGANIFPEGPAIGNTPINAFGVRCLNV